MSAEYWIIQDKEYPAIEHDLMYDTWWFWDETWASQYGPYESRDEAIIALNNYASSL